MNKIKNRYNEIIDKMYDKYNELFDSYYPASSTPYPKRLTKEEFIQEIKNGGNDLKEFQLDVKIVERPLEYFERRRYRAKLVREGKIPFRDGIVEDDFKDLDENNIPTKKITLEYNEEIVEYYE
jgi:hypothetical protein